MDFNFDNMKQEIMNPEDVSDMFSEQDINANKLNAAATTLPILFWLPFVVSKDSAFVKFYGNQSLILLIVCAVCWVVGWLIGLIPVLGTIVGIVLGLVCLAGFVFLLISALQGKARRLPVLGKLFTIFPEN